MKVVEVIALFGSGYVSGLSISSGLIFWALRKYNQATWSSVKETLWTAGACANILVGTLTPVLLVGAVVVGDSPDRPDFWPRMILFAAGVIVGGALVVFGAQKIIKWAPPPDGRGV